MIICFQRSYLGWDVWKNVWNFSLFKKLNKEFISANPKDSWGLVILVMVKVITSVYVPTAEASHPVCRGHCPLDKVNVAPILVQECVAVIEFVALTFRGLSLRPRHTLTPRKGVQYLTLQDSKEKKRISLSLSLSLPLNKTWGPEIKLVSYAYA